MINRRLVELARRHMNPEPPKPRAKTKKQTQSLTGILERDSNGKPKLNLTPMEETVVNTPTQEDYNQLVMVYECGGWEWYGGGLPTKYSNWDTLKEETCIDAGSDYPSSDEGKFGRAEKEWFEERGCKILTPQDFYDTQDPPITREMLSEINEWFEQNG